MLLICLAELGCGGACGSSFKQLLEVWRSWLNTVCLFCLSEVLNEQDRTQPRHRSRTGGYASCLRVQARSVLNQYSDLQPCSWRTLAQLIEKDQIDFAKHAVPCSCPGLRLSAFFHALCCSLKLSGSCHCQSNCNSIIRSRDLMHPGTMRSMEE